MGSERLDEGLRRHVLHALGPVLSHFRRLPGPRQVVAYWQPAEEVENDRRPPDDPLGFRGPYKGRLRGMAVPQLICRPQMS